MGGVAGLGIPWEVGAGSCGWMGDGGELGSFEGGLETSVYVGLSVGCWWMSGMTTIRLVDVLSATRM
jgi:hypothetical protein